MALVPSRPLSRFSAACAQVVRATIAGLPTRARRPPVGAPADPVAGRAEAGPTRASSPRLVAVDALRGLALALMALDHSAFFTWSNISAEYRQGMPFVLESWPRVATGLITNIAAPTFWVLSGVSIALLAAAHARRGAAGWPITRFLLIRAAILWLLDLSIVAVAWGTTVERVGHYYEFGVLSSLAVSMGLISVLRFLPDRILLALSLVSLIGYQGLVTAIARLSAPPHAFWLALWVGEGRPGTPPIEFPVLGWVGLMGLGHVLGRHLSAPLLRQARPWLALAAGLAVGWAAIRLGGGYGNFVAYLPGEPWTHLVITSKWPPSLDFFTLNLAIIAALIGLSIRVRWRMDGYPSRWLVDYGRASLFFYVIHLLVFLVVGYTSIALFPSVSSMIRHYLVWAVGLVLLLALCRGYRRLRAAHPTGILRYL